jgi:pimeloyl-ACP methyl ester carboxylesterase
VKSRTRRTSNCVVTECTTRPVCRLTTVIVFVHGVPETAALWDKLRGFLQRDSVAVSLPGFGCARPAEFAATHDAYVAWLCDEIGRLGPPVDLVGHDWGAALTYRVARAHGDLLRSWAADSAQMVHPDYEWHEVARCGRHPARARRSWRRTSR